MAKTKNIKVSKPAVKKKKSGRLARFLSNRKLVGISVFVLIFVGVGSYYFYRKSSAAVTKTTYQCAYFKTVLKFGSTGACVESLEYALNSKYMRPQGGSCATSTVWPCIWSPDTVFREDTTQAVKGFQIQYSLTVDGVVGPNTWAKLNKRCSDLAAYGIHVYGCYK